MGVRDHHSSTAQRGRDDSAVSDSRQSMTGAAATLEP